jgi:hypothetical protein
MTLFFGLGAAALMAPPAHAQSWGRNTEMVWRCSKCKGLVGSGPNAPSLCPHCKSKLIGGWGSSGASSPPPPRSAQVNQNEESAVSVGTVLVLGVVFLTMAGLVGFVLKQTGH